MQVIGIIPSRYASTRFPGKPLALIAGKPMVQWVYERASLALEHVYVATDDQRIADAVAAFGGRFVMTSDLHRSGTDRCAQAVSLIEESTGAGFEVVVNIQGDEPFIKPAQILALTGCFHQAGTDIATLVKPIESEDELFDPNKPKVVLSNRKTAMYFSRSPIPFLQGADKRDWHKKYLYYRHIGIYAYRRKVLSEIALLQASEIEIAESLEQLRWLAHGYTIRAEETAYGPFGIDTPEDLAKAIGMTGDIDPWKKL